MIHHPAPSDHAVYQQTLDLRVARVHELAGSITAKVGDGTPFFDAMDLALSTEYWFAVQLNRYFGLRDSSLRIVVSGEWGRQFRSLVMGPSRWPYLSPLVLPGGLRHNDLAPLELDLTGHRFVFLDDSCYKGRTRDKIRQRIREAGGDVAATLVIYDGSVKPIRGIAGLWRWHSAR